MLLLILGYLSELTFLVIVIEISNHVYFLGSQYSDITPDPLSITRVGNYMLFFFLQSFTVDSVELKLLTSSF